MAASASLMGPILLGKTAIITGASSGIGESIATLFAKLGVRQMVLGGRDVAALNIVKDRCLAELPAEGESKQAASDIAVCPGDIRDGLVRSKMVDEASRRFGRIDILVNNAGMSRQAQYLDGSVSLAAFDEVVAVNVKAPIDLANKTLPHLLKSKGVILNMSSAVTGRQLPKSTIYAASKVAVDMMTKCQAQELGPHGIRVNCINPAIIRSQIHARSGFIPEGTSEVEYYQKAGAAHMLDRVGEPIEVATLAAFLVSDLASFISGSCIAVDGAGLVFGRSMAVLLAALSKP